MTTAVGDLRDIALTDLVVHPENMRRSVGDIDELALSIQEQGIIEPLVAVRQNGHFAVIAGSRRLAAARQVGLVAAPVLVRDLTDDEATAIALVENLHREDLSPLEEAQGYARWLELKGKAGEKVTHDDLAKAVGKARSSVTNTLRLLEAPEPVKAALGRGDITAAHARIAMSVPADLVPALSLDKKTTVGELEDQAAQLKRAGAAIAKLRKDIEIAAMKGIEVTWYDRETWIGNVRLNLADVLGKPPKNIAGDISAGIQLNSAPWNVQGTVAVHDAACECRAAAPELNNGSRIERVCVSPAGWKKYRAALAKSVKTKTGAVKKKVISAAAKQAAVERELKHAVAEATKALDGKSLESYHAVKLDVDERFLKGGLSAEPARLALFGFVADLSDARGKTWKVELWKLIAKMPLKDVRQRVTQWAVAVGFQQIRESSAYGPSKGALGRNNAAVIRALVNEHYGATKTKKSKKKAAR